MKIRKTIGIIVLPLAIISIFFPGRIINTYLYYKNGSTLVLSNYKIDFPLSHWAYFEKIDNGHLITGRKVNDVVLKISVYEPKVSIESLLNEKCDRLTCDNMVFRNIKGKMYYCFTKIKDFESIYFQTEDNRLMLITYTYDKNNSKNIDEFNLLLDGIIQI